MARKILIIGMLLLLMYALQFLQVRSDAPLNPQSLAILGFILLAAYTFGEITNAIGFPKITGYIVTGIVFGPYVINLFSSGVVSDLKLINSLAIGLIALTAGGEMKLRELRRVGRTLALVVILKGFLILILITLTVLAARSLIPFLAPHTTWLVLSVGMIFGVLAIGTSPAATVAVINETESVGRLSTLTLGVAVVKDVFMVILLAVAISLTQLFLNPGAVFDPTALVGVGKELALSVGAGVVIGVLIIAYIRFVRAEMWLFIISIILFATTLSHHFHLETLLEFITAGFVVQNFSRFGDEFIHPIERMSLPVYVVFFSIAGADLNLLALKEVWIVALLLVGVRLVAIYAGTRLATSLTKESPEIRQNAWLGYIAQAGVVLGLSIILETTLPGLGSEIKTIVLAIVAFNLILGPVMFKVALSRVGETKEERKKRAASEPTPLEIAPAASPSMEIPQPPTIRFPSPEFPSTELNVAVNSLRDAVLNLQRDFEETFLDTQTRELKSFIRKMETHTTESLTGLAEALRTMPEMRPQNLIHRLRESRTVYSRVRLSTLLEFSAGDGAVERAKRAFREFHASMNAICEDAEKLLTVPQEVACFQSGPGDSAYIAAVKRVKGWLNSIRRLFGSGAGLTRTVYLYRLAKYHLAGTLPPQMIKIANLTAAHRLMMLRKSRLLYSQIEEGYEALITQLEKQELADQPMSWDPVMVLTQMRVEAGSDFAEAVLDLDRYRVDLRRQLAQVLSSVFSALLDDLAIAGTFELPRRKFRFSKIYEKSEKAKSDIAKVFDRWAKYYQGYTGSYAKHLEVIMLMDEASQVVDQSVAGVLESIDEKLIASVSSTEDACTRTYHHLAEAFAADQPVDQLVDTVALQQETIDHFINQTTLKKLTRLLESRELNALIDIMLQRFSILADQMPEEYLVLDDPDLEAVKPDGASPPDVRLKTAPLREVTRSYLETEIARDLADVNHAMFEQVNETIQSVTEVAQFVNFNLKTSLEELNRVTEAGRYPEDLTHPKELALGGLQRGITKLQAALVQIDHAKKSVYDRILMHVDERMRTIETLILEHTSFDMKVHLRKRKAVQRGFLYFRAVGRWLSRRIRRLIRRYKPVGQVVVKDLKTTLGLQQFTPSEILAIYDQAKLDSTAIASLPFIYQRLFEIRPLESGDFLIGRRDELETVETARQRWQQGMPCSVAVIGEVGSGKTSFINAMLKQVLGDYPISKTGFANTITRPEELALRLSELLGSPATRRFADLHEWLLNSSERRVVVLEDAHKLYLRTLGGFEALRQLLLLVAATSHQVLWVITMREYAWRYLDNVVNISDHFTFVINTENLSRDELEQVILSRHRVSGFDVRFVPDQAMLQRKKYRRSSEQEKQAMLRRIFFEELGRASEGNILAAIFYWLRSLGGAEGNDLIVVPLQKLNFDFLRDMAVDKLLIFGIISQHENLTAEECARIFGCDVKMCLSTLTYLTNINLLVKSAGTDDQDRFAVNRLIYKPLSKELRARNILH